MSVASRIRPIDVVLAPLYWLERSRGWRRRLLILGYLIVGTIVGVLTWRATSLRNLPDIGDPFDVAAFLASAKVPEPDDASVLYRRAAGKYVPSVATQDLIGLMKAVQGGWATGRPDHRAWVESNRPALAVWLEATDKALASPISPSEMSPSMGLTAAIAALAQAASLEGSRLQEGGDPKAAWLWYRGVLRVCGHLRGKSTPFSRETANMIQRETSANLQRWLASAETDATLLRAAIEELTRLDSQAPPTSDSYKANYLEIMAKLDDPTALGPKIDSNYETAKPYLQSYLFMKREPERSRRVARLMFANWLAYCDRPRLLRPTTLTDPRFPGVWYLYQTDAQAPANASAMNPQEVLNWFKTTWFLIGSLPPMQYAEPSPEQEHRVYADLLVTAAERLYLLENGKKSPGVEALVPHYLKTIPDAYAPAPVPAN